MDAKVEENRNLAEARERRDGNVRRADEAGRWMVCSCSTRDGDRIDVEIASWEFPGTGLKTALTQIGKFVETELRKLQTLDDSLLPTAEFLKREGQPIRVPQTGEIFGRIVPADDLPPPSDFVKGDVGPIDEPAAEKSVEVRHTTDEDLRRDFPDEEKPND
jgi:hypothetical protein